MKNFVNSLKDFRTYTTDISIVSIDKKSKQPKKGNLILYIGNIPNEDLVTTLNSGVLFYNNFRSIYKPRNYYSANKKIKRLNLQKDYYKLLPELGFHDAYDTRLNIQSYLDRNLIIDLTEFISVEMQSMSGKNLSAKGAAFKAAIQHMVDSVGYENTTLLINASATSAEATDGKVFNDNFTTIIRFLRRNVNFLPEGKVDNIIFHNPQKRSLLKIAVTEENIAKVFGDKVPTVLINRLLQLSASTDELTKEEHEEVEKEKTTTDDEEATTSSVSTNHTTTTPGQKPLASQSTPAKPTRTKKGQAEFEEKVNNASLRALTMLKGKISDEDKKSLTSSIEKSLNEVNIDHISKNDDDELLDLALRHNPEISEHIMAIIKASEIGSNNVKRQHAHAENMKKTAELMSSSKIRDLVERAKSSSIDDEPLKQAHNVNPEMNKTLRTNEFDKSYASKKFMSDIVNVFNSFSDDSDIPLNIIDFQVEETSDDQNSKETMYITMKDDMNVKHKLTIDIPKVYDGKYIKINGGKKIINKMFVMLPIVKTKPNEVWITTDYNKLIIERFGRKTNSQVDYLSRVIDKIDYRKHTGIRYRRGNSLTVNTKYKTSLEYSELSQRILSLEFGDFRIIFNQKLLADEIATGKGIKNYDYDTNKYFPVGFYKKRNLILSNITDGTLYILSNDSTYDIVNTVECKSFNLSTFIITSLDVATDGELKSLLSFSVKSNESLTFSRVKIINKRIPMIVLLGYEVGLFNVLDRYGVDYQVTTKEPRLSIQDNKSKIKFEDGWLIYDSSKVRNTLLLAGLRVLHTEEYSISEFNGKDPYLDYFQNEFNSRNVSKGVHNAMTLLLDPITKEILKEMELPTNVIDLLLTANTMLEDLESRQFNDMNIYRMRGTEQIPALLYKIVAESYKNYKDSMNNRNPIKLSVPSNILIKSLMELSTVDEASDLNPSLEIDKQTAVTYRGVSGRNSADSYTEEIRGYDKSMEGILGITTPDSATVGVVRQLSANPNIKSVRGFLDTSGDTTDSTSAYTPLELLTSYTSRHADPPRIGIKSVCHLGVTLG